MTSTDTDRLTEIRARLDAALCLWQPEETGRSEATAEDSWRVEWARQTNAGIVDRPEGELIANAPEDIEFLLSELEAAQALAASWQERFEDVRTELHRQLDTKDKQLDKAQAQLAEVEEERDEYARKHIAATNRLEDLGVIVDDDD